MSSKEKSGKDKDKGASSDKGPVETGGDEECVTFEPQTWRRYQCKNCFRTSDEHEPPKPKETEANGSPGRLRSKDVPASTVSSMAAKFLPKDGEKAAKGGKGKAKGSAAATADIASDKGSSPKIAGDSLIAQRTAGLFKKETEPGAAPKGKDQKWKGGKKGKKGSGDVGKAEGKGASLNGAKKLGSLSPVTPKKPPQSSPTGKKAGPLSPETGKKGVTGQPSPATGKKGVRGQLSPATGMKGVTGPLSPATGKKGVSVGKEQDNDAAIPAKDAHGTGKKQSKGVVKSSKDTEDINKHKSDSSPSDDSPRQQTPTGGDGDECIGAQSAPTPSGGDVDEIKIVGQVTVVGEGERGVGEGDGLVRVEGGDGQGDSGVSCERDLVADQTVREIKGESGEVSEVCEGVSFSLGLPLEEPEQAPIGDQQPDGVQGDRLGAATNTDTVPAAARGPAAPTPPLSPTITAPPPGVQDENHPQQQQQQQQQQQEDSPSAGGRGDVDVPHSPLSVPETPLVVEVRGSATLVEEEGEEEEGEGQTSRANQGEAGPLEEDDPTAPGGPEGEVGGEVGLVGGGEYSDAGAEATQGAERGQGTEGHADAGGAAAAAASVEVQEEDQEDFTQGGIEHSPVRQAAAEEEAIDVTLNFSLTPDEAPLPDVATLPLEGAGPSTRGASPLPEERRGASPAHTPTLQVAVAGGTTDEGSSNIVAPNTCQHTEAGTDDTLPPGDDIIHTAALPPHTTEGAVEEAGEKGQTPDAGLPSDGPSVCQQPNGQIENTADSEYQQHQLTEEGNSSLSEAETDKGHTQPEEGDAYSGDADEDNAAFRATFVLTTEASQETETEEDLNIFSASEETKPQETVTISTDGVPETIESVTEDTVHIAGAETGDLSIHSTSEVTKPQETITISTDSVTETIESITEDTAHVAGAEKGDLSIHSTSQETKPQETITISTDSVTETIESITEDTAQVAGAETGDLSIHSTSQETKPQETITISTDSVTETIESITEDTVCIAGAETHITGAEKGDLIINSTSEETKPQETVTVSTDGVTETTEGATNGTTSVTEALSEDVTNVSESVSSSQKTTPESLTSAQAEIVQLLPAEQQQQNVLSLSTREGLEGHAQEELVDSERKREAAADAQEELKQEGSGDQTLTATGEFYVCGSVDSEIIGVDTGSPSLSGEQQPDSALSTPVVPAVSAEPEPGAAELDSPCGIAQEEETPPAGVSECFLVHSPGGTTEREELSTTQEAEIPSPHEEVAPPGLSWQYRQEDDEFSRDSPGVSVLPEEFINSAEIIVLECPPEGEPVTADYTEESREGECHQVPKQLLSPEDGSEQWFETETELPPPVAFSDTTGAACFSDPTLGGATTEQPSPTPGGEGSGEVAALGVELGGGDIGSPLEGLEVARGDGQLPLRCNTREAWRSGEGRPLSEPEASVGSCSPEAQLQAVGAGLLSIVVPTTPIATGIESDNNNTGLLLITTTEEYGDYLSASAGAGGEEGSPREAVSPLVVRASGEAPGATGGAALLTTGETALLAPLSVDVTSEHSQGPPERQTPPSAAPPVEEAALSDVRGREITPEGEAWGSSVVGEPHRTGEAEEEEEEKPAPWCSTHPTGGAAPDGGAGAAQTTTTQIQPAQHQSPPVTRPAGGEVATVSLIITATSRNTSDTDADIPARTPSAQTPEVAPEFGPVVAATFSPGVSSPESSSSTSSYKGEVKVAAATISLKQPSPQEPEVVVGQRTCVSKVASFVISAPQPEQQKPPSPVTPERKSVDFDSSFTTEPNRTLVINNSKYDYDSAEDAISEGYGGYPQGGAHHTNNSNQRRDDNFENNNLDEEDTTAITTVNVKNKKKVRQRPAHQQLQFDHTYQRSSSVPDNNIFCIASHKPGDSAQQGADAFNFDRTLQFGPSGRQRRRRMSDAFVREDAMMEGTRMLIENLREKQHLLEEKCARLEREKSAVSDLLTVKKHELQKTEARSSDNINTLEIICARLEAENVRLLERLNLPETDRNNFRDQELELSDLRRKLAEAEDVISQLSEDSACLQHEVKDMHLEMEEMHDQFRDDEALEFRDMQKELEATAKNCRILQFKLRKAERRNDALQSERLHFDEKIRQLESRTSNNTEQNQIRELEEELRMAKEVSVRLHDELEATEDRRAKFQDELERVHDVLVDSEKGRSVLQKEMLTLTEEVEQLRERVSESADELGDKLDVPKTKKPPLSKTGSQGSMEYDVEQLMRDLADSLEREHDLKGQLEHAEEETINFRKKLSDLEDENEVIQIQLQKMSAAKSGKYFQRSAEDTDQVSKEEHELRLQLELAEEEINILRRKVDETDLENASMKKEVRRLQLKLAGKDSKEIREEEQQEDTRTYDERIIAMASDIDDLKWRLIQKDQESASKDDVERHPKDQENTTDRGLPVSRPVKLIKSLSLDSAYLSADLWKHLDSATPEAGDLRDKILQMEKEIEELRSRNKALELGVPTITTDDAPIKNIELQDRVRSLESENSELRETIRSLDDRTTALSRDVNKVNDGRVGESEDLKEQLHLLEADVTSFQRTISELQESNRKLASDLRQYEQTDEGKESKAARDELNLETATKRQLRERIKDLESDSRVLTTIVRNRESENESLEREVEEYRADMDKMLDKFKAREANLEMELQSWEQKNVVLSNLLDLVTERAESFKSSPSEKQSERSASVVSAVSDVTMGSDEVFGEKTDLNQDWDEKFLCRIRSLEDLLKEERQKVQAVEKRLEVKDGQQSALTDDMKLHEREKEILQQEQIQKQILERERGVIQEELILCQRQLSETTDQSQALREKLDTMHKIQNILRADFQRVTKELEVEKSASDDYKQKLDAKEAEGKKTVAKDEEKEKKSPGARDAKFVGVGGLKDKEPASWRWEKQQFETTIKDLRKKSDDLHRQLSRQQVRVKLAGDDMKPRLGRQDSVEADPGKSKELETEVKMLKEEAEKRKADIATMDIQIKELQSTLKCQEKQWDTEREVLEGDRKAVIKELTQKDEVLKAKDEIIKSKDSLLQQKESALKTRENSMLNHDMIMKEKDDIIAKLQDMQNDLLEQLEKLREEVKQQEEAQREMELKIKEINAAVSARDGRIKEKDDIIEKLNRSLSEKESNLSDMDNAIRQAMKSMDDKECEIKKLQAETEEQKVEIVNIQNKSDDFERTLHSTEKEHGKEIASLVILREKMEALIQQLNTEKALVEGEVQDIKRVLMEKEDFWRSCRNELETELRSANEKVHTLEGVRSRGNQSEVIMKLTMEKDDMMNEKNILVKEVKRLARELENAEMDWAQERRKLSQSISNKEGEVSELQARNWQSDITDELSRQPSLSEEGATAPLSPPAPTVDPRVEILRKAEIASIEELYENKLKITRQQIRQAQDEMDQMRKENSLARDLLLSSQKTLSEVKHKYDVTVTKWQDEKGTLERRAAESDDRRRQVEALQRVVEQLEGHITQLEAERTDLDGKVMKMKADWDSDKLELQTQANKYEEHSAMTSSGKFKWSERSKREAAWESERANHQRALTEYQNLVRDLEVRAKTAERTRERDQKDLLAKLESCRKNMDREVTDLRKRCAEGQEQTNAVAGLQKTLIDLQYKLQSDREVWLRERAELQRQLADSEKIKLDEKNKFTELLAEVKRVKELTPLLSKTEGGVELEIQRKRKPESPQSSPSGAGSPHVYDLSPGSQREHTGNSVVTTIPIRRLVDDPYDKPLIEALQHISQLAEDLSKTSAKRSSKVTGPPAFRRSLSTSEVEEYREYVEYAQKQEKESQSCTPDPHSQIPSSPPTITSTAVDSFALVTRVPAAPPMSVDNSMDDLTTPLRDHSSFRSRFPSAVPDIQISASTERASRPGSARNSMYASGTQSAYTSRDASPERRFGPRKMTPYPVAPPSFLITPSRTPRRVTASMDREISMPEKHLQKLYDKLSAIEQEQTDEEFKTQQRLQREGSVEAHIEATDSRRKSGMRMLVKSMSVDSYRDDPNWMPTDATPGPNAHFCPKQLDTVFDDAPKSQTLPASVRYGQTMIIPGSGQQLATDYTDLTNKVEYLNTRRKSQDARKDFYENYPLYSSGFFSLPRKSRRDRHQDEMMSVLAATEEAQEMEIEAQRENTTEQRPATTAATAAVAPQQQQPEQKRTIVPFGKHKKKKEKDAEAEKKESKLSYFFSSVKERRNIFMKKSRSVDESPVRKSVMKAGLQASRPAAPSTFESPPENGKEAAKEAARESKPPLPTTTASSKSQPSSLRQKFHKRAASLDVTSLFSVSSGASGSSEQGSSNSGSGHNRHSSIGTSGGAATTASSAGHTSSSGSKDQSRDGRRF